MQGLLQRIDHLVYATLDLPATIGELRSLLGADAVAGGRHPQWGTRNALIPLGPRTYLEIIGPDPEASAVVVVRPFGLDALRQPRLATWAARDDDLHSIVQQAAGHGVDLGEVREGGRRKPDGTQLSWRMTDPLSPREDGLVPFFIDWGGSQHPAEAAPALCSLLDLRAEHPEPDRVRGALAALGLALPVSRAREPALIATLRCPRGEIELR